MELMEKIKSHQAVIGVIGMGYVGLPLLLEFVSEDFYTIISNTSRQRKF